VKRRVVVVVVVVMVMLEGVNHLGGKNQSDIKQNSIGNVYVKI